MDVNSNDRHQSLKKKYSHFFDSIEKAISSDSVCIFYVFIVVLILLTVFMYFKYLIGTKYYIFNDIGSDSYTQIYPQLMYLADRISSGKIGALWNSYNSLGNPDVIALPLLWDVSAFFGRENVAYLMGFVQVIRILLSGMFFYAYLKIAGRSRLTSAVFGLVYAFCGHMIVRGCWMSYPNEVVFLALWLLSFELFFKKNNWWLLPISTALIFLNLSGYYVIFYTALFFAYAIFREYTENTDKVFSKGRLMKLAKFSLFILLGLLASSILSFESLSTMLSSQRLANGKSSFWDNLKSQAIFNDSNTLKSIFYSFFGTDILGINDYTGPYNILGGPAFYCGLISILLVPYTLNNAKGKKKIWYTLIMVIVLLYLFIRPVRLLANALSSTQFKLSSFWIIVVLIFMASEGFEMIRNKDKVINKKLLLSELFIIILLAYLLRNIGIYSYIMVVSLICLCIYCALLCYYEKKNKMIVLAAIALIVPFEIAFEDYRLINDRGTVNRDVIDTRQGFNDYTSEALDTLEEDESSFYRVDKQYESVSFTDSLYQKYFGTKAYIGATGDLKKTGEFYDSLNFAVSGGNNHVMLGFTQSSVINTLMNVKYIFSKSPLIGNYGYTYVNNYNDIYIYKNNYSLPVGYEYKTVMDRDDFEKLSITEKRYALSKYAIVDKENINSFEKISKVNNYTFSGINADVLPQFKTDFSYNLNDNALEITFPPVKKGNMVLLKMSVDCNGSNSTTYMYSTEDVSNYAWYNFNKGVYDYTYEFNDVGTRKVSFTLNSPIKVNDIAIYEIPQNLYYKEYEENINNLKATNSDIHTDNGENFYGTYKTDTDAILTFSIPYSDKWELYVNGEQQTLTPVNIGFMGCYLPKGEYNIELLYKGSVKYIWISIASIISYICLLFYSVYKKRK